MRLIQLEEIEQLVLQVPRILELEEQQPAAFVARATIWMDLLEQALVAARSYQAARVAVLRSQLVFARSTVARDAAEPRSQPTRAQRLAFEAAAAMTEAAGIASAVLDEHRPRFAEAERRMRALVAKTRSLDLLAATPMSSAASQLADARRAISGRRDLERQLAAIEATVGADDAKVLLSRAISPIGSARIANSRQEGADHAGERR